jgi:predicted aldo/keto reductase-like oxidoreductase
MSDQPYSPLSRRQFLQHVGLAGAAGAGVLLAAPRLQAAPAAPAFPQRLLGRTGRRVSTLALGTWPCGKSSEVDVPAVGELVTQALALGINFVDAANVYGKAEEAIGIALEGRRDEVFLASKVWADTAEEAERSLEDSLKKLRTDYFDLMYIHSIGNRDVTKVMGQGGSLEYLLRKKEQGVVRSIGLSGHHYPERFLPLIHADVADVLMVAMNFVDRHTYGFETKVLPAALEHNMGIACMKVYGGMKGGFPAAAGANTGAMVPEELKQRAVRYALGLPGVATCVIGPHTVEQLRENAELVRSYQPLSDEEYDTLMREGQRLAATWKDHFGPVA